MIVFQAKGKEHIRYIKKITDDMWAKNKYQIYRAICLEEVLKNHRKYIASGTEVLLLKKAPSLPIGRNTTWRMDENDEWEPVVTRG